MGLRIGVLEDPPSDIKSIWDGAYLIGVSENGEYITWESDES
jgi:hypothetical protein